MPTKITKTGDITALVRPAADRLLRDFAWMQRRVARLKPGEQLDPASVVEWFLAMHGLKDQITTFLWNFKVRPDARLGAKVRATKRRASGKAATARQRKAATRRQAVLALVPDYLREHPDHRDRTIAANLARTTGVPEGTIRGYLRGYHRPKKMA